MTVVRLVSGLAVGLGKRARGPRARACDHVHMKSHDANAMI